MLAKFYVYNMTRYVGVLTHNPANHRFFFKQERFGKFQNEAVKKLALDMTDNQDAIEYCLIEDRVAPEDRDNIHELLSFAGLPYYDAWELSKRNNGMSIEDFIWYNTEKVDGRWFWENHILADIAYSLVLRGLETGTFIPTEEDCLDYAKEWFKDCKTIKMIKHPFETPQT